jgi:hypothetical protein
VQLSLLFIFFKKKLSLLEFDLETLYLDGVGLIEFMWIFLNFFINFINSFV